MKKLTYIALMTLTVLTICVCTSAYAEAIPTTAPAATPVIDLTQIMTAVLGLLATIVTAYVVPWLRAKAGDTRYRWTQSVILSMVRAAEKVYGPGQGADKLAYVKRQLEQRGITIDAEEIEAAVYGLGQAFLIEDAVEVATEVDLDEE